MHFDFLDGLLRGEIATQDLVRGRRALGVGGLVLAIVGLGAMVGACMALYGLRWGTAYGTFHLVAVMAKVPVLFLLTLVVTCPSLYVFSALARSTLRFRETVRLLLAATALALTILASLAPVIAFFTFGTRSHPFLQTLNAVFFVVAGTIALLFVRRTLAAAAPADAEKPMPRTASRSTDRIVLAWCCVYALVGAQMAWMMRPFIGTRHLPQELFRNVESNVFAGLLQALKYLVD
jgi:hypothetical protein